MQIDTHNRAYNATDDTVGYKRWLLPKGDDMATGYNVMCKSFIKCL